MPATSRTWLWPRAWVKSKALAPLMGQVKRRIGVFESSSGNRAQRAKPPTDTTRAKSFRHQQSKILQTSTKLFRIPQALQKTRKLSRGNTWKRPSSGETTIFEERFYFFPFAAARSLLFSAAISSSSFLCNLRKHELNRRPRSVSTSPSSICKI